MLWKKTLRGAEQYQQGSMKIPRSTQEMIPVKHILNDGTYAAQYFASLWQRIRKRGGYIIGATQNTTEILNSPEARKLLENSYIITMLYQSAPDRDVLAEMFSLSEAQKQALAKEQYGTGLIKVGSTIVPFENDFPTDNPLYQLMSTKPSDGWGQEVNEHYDV